MCMGCALPWGVGQVRRTGIVWWLRHSLRRQRGRRRGLAAVCALSLACQSGDGWQRAGLRRLCVEGRGSRARVMDVCRMFVSEAWVGMGRGRSVASWLCGCRRRHECPKCALPARRSGRARWSHAREVFF